MLASDTIVPPDLDTGGRGAIEAVAALTGGASVQLKFGEILGEGGMGVIHAAEQVALGRTVAVKSVKADHPSRTAVRDLLREAWITSIVEHPSVVPVHYLEFDRRGAPMIVLKKVDGTVWSRLLREPDEVKRRFAASDQLAWNLGILIQLLNAVAFAHSRGILHRDLKPANVMIGDFGEVYLLDWGIAVSLRDDGSGRLPLASRVRQLAGTPGYMAPEMLGREGDVLDERTDVYLAGAVLYEIVVGAPPHQGRDPLAMITHILTAEPQLPAGSPPELERICSRALALEPADRYPSIEELRLDLVRYLEHRGSSELAEQAAADLVGLRAQVATASREEIYRLFGACKFGFHQALAVWRDNTEARAGLLEAVVTLAEYELANDHPTAALAVLGEIEAPPEILARATAAAKAEALRKAELERVHRDNDLQINRRARGVIGLVLGLFFTVLPLFQHFTRLGYRDANGEIMFSSLVTIVVLAIGYWKRNTLGSTAINRRMLVTIAIVFIAQTLLGIGVRAQGLSVLTLQVNMIMIWATVATLFAVYIDTRLTPAALGYGIAFIIASFAPHTRPYVAAASNLVLAINVVRVWRPHA